MTQEEIEQDLFVGFDDPEYAQVEQSRSAGPRAPARRQIQDAMFTLSQAARLLDATGGANRAHAASLRVVHGWLKEMIADENATRPDDAKIAEMLRVTPEEVRFVASRLRGEGDRTALWGQRITIHKVRDWMLAVAKEQEKGQ